MDRRKFLQTSVKLPAVLSVLTSCSKSRVQIETIKIGVTSRPRMLDPRKATDALSNRINRLIYQQLIDFNRSFFPTPSLASWQQLSLTHYRLKLIKQSFFHNGKPLTAVDVVATYQSILDKDFGSPHRGSLKHIEQITALNNEEVDFCLLKPDPLFISRLVIGILPADLIAKNHSFVNEPVGSGACTLVKKNEQKIVLARKDKVHLEFITVKDATIRILKLKKGELDIIQNDLSPELLDYCKKRPDEFRVLASNGTGFSYIGFNFEDPILADINIRKAIAYAINRQEIIAKLFVGYARLAGGLLVPEHWSGVQGLTGYEFNLTKAKKHLSLAKVDTKDGLTLSFKTSSDPTRVRIAAIYQAQLKKIGIKLNIQSYDWGTFYSDIKNGRFQLYSLAWVGVKSPDIFQYVFDSNAIPPKGANRGRYKNELADRLIREANQSSSLTKQAETYRKLQVHLQQTLAIIPLWYEDQYAVTRLGIKGYKVFSDGRFDALLTTKKL